MNKNEIILKYSILAGALYFLCISLFHLLGVKVPGLFIYYNIPSLQYQDKIISFLSFGWTLFFYSAAKNKTIVPFVLVAGVFALLGLVNINFSTDFNSLVSGITTTPFWIQTILLFFYVTWLIIFYIKSSKTE